MRPSDITKYNNMTDEQLTENIPNWQWFKHLSVEDEVIVWLCDCFYLSNYLNDNGYTLAKVISVNEDGSVDIDKLNLRFYYCRHPNNMNAIVALIPATDEYRWRALRPDAITEIRQKLDDLDDEKVKRILEIVKE